MPRPVGDPVYCFNQGITFFTGQPQHLGGPLGKQPVAACADKKAELLVVSKLGFECPFALGKHGCHDNLRSTTSSGGPSEILLNIWRRPYVTATLCPLHYL